MEWTHCKRALVSLAWGSPQITIWSEQKGNPSDRYQGLDPDPPRLLRPPYPNPIALRRNEDLAQHPPDQLPGVCLRFTAQQVQHSTHAHM